MNEGWKCPVCGRGVAPSEKTCDHNGAVTVAPTPYPIIPHWWPGTIYPLTQPPKWDFSLGPMPEAISGDFTFTPNHQ